jgi:uncharacterized membrane protein
MKHIVVACASWALAAGCADAGRSSVSRHLAAAPDTTLVYECEGGLSFVTAIRGDTAWAFLPSGTAPLPQVPAASGARYGDGSTVLWSKGDATTLQQPGEPTRTCRNNRARAIWEHARLRGVSFRAVGNEPGWYLEIAADSVRLVTDYGARSRVMPTPEPRMDTVADRTVYRMVAEGEAVEVLLEPGPCRDTMSGEEFETTVTVVLVRGTLRGCGRALH